MKDDDLLVAGSYAYANEAAAVAGRLLDAVHGRFRADLPHDVVRDLLRIHERAARSADYSRDWLLRGRGGQAVPTPSHPLSWLLESGGD